MTSELQLEIPSSAAQAFAVCAGNFSPLPFSRDSMEHISFTLLFQCYTDGSDVVSAKAMLSVFKRKIKNDFSSFVTVIFRRRSFVKKEMGEDFV